MKTSPAIAVVLAVAATLLRPSEALAHARLVGSAPADGAVVARAPGAVRLVFDDAVEPLPGTRAIRNGDGSVLAGTPKRASGAANVLVVPLRRGLRKGDYTVAWRALSDDGHTVTGVLAFGVGAGRAPPVPALKAAGGGPGVVAVVSRSLFLLGLLTALGACVFDAIVWRPALGAGIRRQEPGHLLAIVFAGFVLVLLGTMGLVPHHVSAATRAERLYNVAAAGAAIGAMTTAIRYAEPRLRWAPLAVVLALLPLPSLAGHASDASPVVLSTLADILHTGAAAVWVGGVLALALAVPAVARGFDPERRAAFQREAARRFSGVALVSVALIAATGIIRALRELVSVDQLWSTGYGRALLVKSALLAALLALGWRNRARLIPSLPGSFTALIRNVRAEAVVMAALVVAVGFLTALTPGRELAPAALAERTRPAPGGLRLPPPPASDAVVLGREAGDLAVGLALTPARRALRLQVSVLGPNGSGADGLGIEATAEDPAATVSATAQPCGSGCYRARLPVTRPRLVAVRIDGAGRRPAVARFRLPQPWPPAAPQLLRRASASFRGLRTLRIRERLASSPTNVLRTTYDVAAPNRLRYRIEGRGEAILIGSRRWDRAPGGRWLLSPQSPIRQPTPTWSARASNAHLVARGPRTAVLTFFDRSIPAWFTLAVDRSTDRPRELRMTAAAHFMHHTYSRFNAPLEIQPPR